MDGERFSPVNEISEFVSPILSPSQEEIVNNNQSPSELCQHHDLSTELDQSIQESTGQREVTLTNEDNQSILNEDLHLSLDKISKHETEQSTQIGELSLVRDTTLGNSTDINLTFDSTLSGVAEAQEVTLDVIDEAVGEVIKDDYTKPIPLPAEGISYIASRNFLQEKGIDLRAKQGCEKRTYIIGQVQSTGTANLSYSQLIPELNPPSSTYVPPVRKQNNRTVGPIITRERRQAQPSANQTFKHYIKAEQKPDKMSVFIQPVVSSFNTSLRRSHEKAELQQLNDRFSSYVQHVRQLGHQFNQLDSSAFQQSCQLLEQQMQNLKNLYEKELENTRKQLEEAHRDTSHLKLEAERNDQVKYELQTCLAAESERSAQLSEDISACRIQMSKLQEEIQQAKNSQNSTDHLNLLQEQLGELMTENDNLRGRYEQEHLNYRQAEDHIAQCDKQSEFERQVNQSTVKELSDRLESANQNILLLESKVGELSQPNSNLGEMLQKVREAASSELKQYQRESEERFNKNINIMRAQIEEDSRRINSLRSENEDFVKKRDDMENEIRSLQSKLNSSEHQLNILKETLTVERNRYANQVTNIERKARQLQELLLDKMHEANLARELQVPLKAEIEAFKVLLEEEERRLQRPITNSSFHQPLFPVTLQNSTLTQTTPKGTASYSSQVPSNNPIITQSYHNSMTTNTVTSTIDKEPCHMTCVSGEQSQNADQVTPPSNSYMTTPGQSVPFPSTCQTVYYSTGPQHTSITNTVNTIDENKPDAQFINNASTVNSYAVSSGTPLIQTNGYMQGIPKPQSVYPVTDPTGNSLQVYPSGQDEDKCLVPTAPPKTPVNPKLNGVLLELGSPLPLQTTSNVYTYETSPSVNKLNLQDGTSSSITRAKSAPAIRFSSRASTADLGKGRDYFEELFTRQKNDRKPLRPYSSPTSTYHDYNTATSSSTGDLKVLEVNQEGKYVRLVNTGNSDAEIGGHMIQQNVGGHPVAVYRFKPHTRLGSHKTVTVWSGLSDPLLHQPPTDFVWKEHQRWGTGPECTTIFCKPNGQAIAWSTAAHRFTRNAFEIESRSTTQEPRVQDQEDINEDEGLTELPVIDRRNQSESVALRREKQSPPSLSVNKHPHGGFPGKQTHPHTCPERPLTSGNDNSSVNRQCRSQTCTPDQPLGQPYAGPLSHRVCGPVARSYAPPPGILTNRKLPNKAENPGVTSVPPSSFMKPHDRFDVGLAQIQSQHHEFHPPMPRPPLYSSW